MHLRRVVAWWQRRREAARIEATVREFAKAICLPEDRALEARMTCPRCGGNMIGDGYRVPVHCEFAEVPPGTEPDASMIYCDLSPKPEKPPAAVEWPTGRLAVEAEPFEVWLDRHGKNRRSTDRQKD